ncbi:MAG: hypothetical protein IID17_11300 [Nitrospinae bacterium]|nr:hypothetical protein [Nitrospinota bacterium]
MKKIFFTLTAILFVFSANTNAFAQSKNRDANLASASYNLNGFQAEDGVTVKLVTRRYGGHRSGGHHYRSHRFGGHRSHRFGYGYGGFRFNYYRPYYKPYYKPYYRPYRNYYLKPYRGYYYNGKGYSGHNNHRSHDRGHLNDHNKGHGHGGHSSHDQQY